MYNMEPNQFVGLDSENEWVFGYGVGAQLKLRGWLMEQEVNKDKRFYILSSTGLGWNKELVTSVDTQEEAEGLVKDYQSWCDPHEVLTIVDTKEEQ